MDLSTRFIYQIAKHHQNTSKTTGEKQHLTTQTQPRHHIKWTTPKGLASLILFIIITALIEAALIIGFQTIGLQDPNAWTTTIFPGTNFSFILSISPLFHILPLSVIIVLLTSWQYLAKYTTYTPPTEATKRTQPPKRTQQKQRFKSLRQFTKRLTKRLQRTGRNIKTDAQKTKGISYLSQRLNLTKPTTRSALTIFFTFLAILFIIVLIEYPDLIHQSTLNLYKDFPALQYFVKGIGQWLTGIGQAVPALGQIGASIYYGLASAGPGLRDSLTSAGTAVTQSIFNADLDAKYVLSQNVAAWTSAILAIIYGAYISPRSRRGPRGR
jgi:hypothetical protein